MDHENSANTCLELVNLNPMAADPQAAASASHGRAAWSWSTLVYNCTRIILLCHPRPTGMAIGICEKVIPIRDRRKAKCTSQERAQREKKETKFVVSSFEPLNLIVSATLNCLNLHCAKHAIKETDWATFFRDDTFKLPGSLCGERTAIGQCLHKKISTGVALSSQKYKPQF